MIGMSAGFASVATSTRLPGRARRHDAVGAGGDRRAHRLLVAGDVAVVERGVDGVAGVVGPLLGAGEEVGPDRIRRRAVRDPVVGLGLGRGGECRAGRAPRRAPGDPDVIWCFLPSGSASSGPMAALLNIAAPLATVFTRNRRRGRARSGGDIGGIRAKIEEGGRASRATSRTILGGIASMSTNSSATRLRTMPPSRPEAADPADQADGDPARPVARLQPRRRIRLRGDRRRPVDRRARHRPRQHSSR